MNSRAMALFLAQKKKKERKLVCKRKRDARRRFQAYVRRQRVATQLFVLLLTRNFFSPTSCTKNMDETEDYHFLGGDLSALELSRLERKLSNVTSGL